MEKKLNILKRIDQGTSLPAIAMEFALKSRLFSLDIEKMVKFVNECFESSSLKKRCLVRKDDNKTLTEQCSSGDLCTVSLPRGMYH